MQSSTTSANFPNTESMASYAPMHIGDDDDDDAFLPPPPPPRRAPLLTRDAAHVADDDVGTSSSPILPFEDDEEASGDASSALPFPRATANMLDAEISASSLRRDDDGASSR
jgi:hypothetical protein